MKKIVSIIILVALLLNLVGCGASNTNNNDADSSQKISLKLAHSQPENHLVNTTAQSFAKLIKEETDGRIDITIYPGETLGTSVEMADAVSNGDVDFYISSTGQFVQRYKPFSIIEAFYMFRDTDHLINFYSSDAFNTLKEGLAETTNVHILAPLYYGARQMTSKKPLTMPKDFEGIKFRVANEAMPIAAIKTLGGAPTPVAYNETYLALQQGVVEAQENPPLSILTMKFYEVQDYLNITDHQFQMMNIFMSDVAKNKLTNEDLQIIQDIADRVSKDHNEVAFKDEEKAIADLEEFLEIIYVDKEAYAEKISPMYEEFKGDWIDGMLEDIKAIK